MTGYETEVEIPVRYRDIDSLGHVNNAVYITYLEQARVE
jgi:acyl-CoA thioester hydrolase